MPGFSNSRLRWIGILFLATAVVLLALGQTVLKRRLDGIVFLGYWFLCFGCTVISMLVALLDIRTVKKTAVYRQKELFHKTVEEIQREGRLKHKRNSKKHSKRREHTDEQSDQHD